jgi:hypothetical protein
MVKPQQLQNITLIAVKHLTAVVRNGPKSPQNRNSGQDLIAVLPQLLIEIETRSVSSIAVEMTFRDEGHKGPFSSGQTTN